MKARGDDAGSTVSAAARDGGPRSLWTADPEDGEWVSGSTRLRYEDLIDPCPYVPLHVGDRARVLVGLHRGVEGLVSSVTAAFLYDIALETARTAASDSDPRTLPYGASELVHVDLHHE